MIAAWIRQLMDPRTVALVKAAGSGQVEVRLQANKDRVRRRPAITIDGGPQQMDGI